MHLEFLVEEASAEAALAGILPRMLTADATYRIHPHQGKQDLLDGLRGKLRAYSRWLPEDWRIVVLIDSDGKDCTQVKRQLERIAKRAGLTTKTAPAPRGAFQTT